MIDPINQAVIDKISGRASVGHKKYGVTMARADLTEIEWLELAQQEAMDLAVYLEKLIQIKSSQTTPYFPPLAKHVSDVEYWCTKQS